MEQTQILNLLGDVKLVKGLEASALTDILARTRQRSVPRGAFFFHQGDAADVFYLLLTGRVIPGILY